MLPRLKTGLDHTRHSGIVRYEALGNVHVVCTIPIPPAAVASTVFHSTMVVGGSTSNLVRVLYGIGTLRLYVRAQRDRGHVVDAAMQHAADRGNQPRVIFA